MAISIDWVNKVIFVPKLDTALVKLTPSEIRQINIEALHLELRTLESSFEGIPFEKTHTWFTNEFLNAFNIPAVFKLINGYTIEFENGIYGVNLKDANNNLADEQVPNDVELRYGAGIQAADDQINSQSYLNARIYIDTVNGTVGTLFPIGTPQTPALDWASASSIQSIENIQAFQIYNSITFNAGDDISNFAFHTDNLINNQIILNGANTLFTAFHDAIVTGTLNGRSNFRRCAIISLNDFSGGGLNCTLLGTITVDPTFVGQISIFQSGSGENGNDRPIFDFGTSSATAIFIDYTGGIFLKNVSQGNDVNVTLNSGLVYVDSTSNNGTILVNGVGQVINNDNGEVLRSGTYNGNLVIQNDTVDPDDNRQSRQFMSNRVAITNNKTRVTVYDDDGTTILQEFNITGNQLNRDPV